MGSEDTPESQTLHIHIRKKKRKGFVLLVVRDGLRSGRENPPILWNKLGSGEVGRTGLERGREFGVTECFRDTNAIIVCEVFGSERPSLPCLTLESVINN